MGRKTKLGPKHPAERVYWKHGAFWCVALDGKWHRIGTEWNREAKAEWARLTSASPASDTVAAMLTAYLKHRRERVAAGKLSANTLVNDERESDKLGSVFGTMPIAAVKKRDVAAYLDKRCDKEGNPAPIRANREISFLSGAYSYYIRKQLVDDNPCLGVPRNEENVGTRYVEHSERRTFAKRCCPDWLRAYLLLKYLTGLRMGDMLRLSRANETQRGIRVSISKRRRRGKPKVLEFQWTWALRNTVGFIHNCAVHDDAVGGSARVVVLAFFRGRSGEPITTSAFKSQWYRSMKQWKAVGGTTFQERDIRAKAASDADERSTDATALLGHDDKRTTERHYLRGVRRVRPLR